MSTTEIFSRPRKEPRQERSRAMVRAILQATAKVLLEEGFAAASTNRIAEVAGVSIGSLYQYFPNKESLVLTLAREHSEGQIARLARDLVDLADLPVHEAVARFVAADIAVHLEEPELHVQLASQVLAHNLASVPELTGQARLLLHGYLAAHADELVVTDLEMASWMLVTTVEAAIHGAVLEDPARLEDPSFERELVALVCRYLGVEGPAAA